MRRGAVRQHMELSITVFVYYLSRNPRYLRAWKKNIQGILLYKEEIILEMFADDVTAFLRNTRSLEDLLHTADLFSKCSGLEINSKKTECMHGHVSSTVTNVI